MHWLERDTEMNSNTETGHKEERSLVQRDVINIINRIKQRISDKPDELSTSQVAAEIKEKLNIDDTQKFPIVEILSAAGIKTYQKVLTPNELSSYIYISPRCVDLYGVPAIICVNIQESVDSKRFALAYELGHYIFDYNGVDTEYYNEYYRKLNNTKDDRVAYYAYSFANDLLNVKQKCIH